MENFFYKCEKCGFIHLVPAYWVDYEAKPTMELEHMDLKTGEMCECTQLTLIEEETSL